MAESGVLEKEEYEDLKEEWKQLNKRRKKTKMTKETQDKLVYSYPSVFFVISTMFEFHKLGHAQVLGVFDFVSFVCVNILN